MAASSLTDRSGLRTVSPATRTLPARIRACARWRDSASPLFVTSTSSLVILVVHPGKRSPIHRPISAERPAGADAGVGGPGACRHASTRCAPPRATPALASAVWAAPWRADSRAHHLGDVLAGEQNGGQHRAHEHNRNQHDDGGPLVRLGGPEHSLIAEVGQERLGVMPDRERRRPLAEAGYARLPDEHVAEAEDQGVAHA